MELSNYFDPYERPPDLIKALYKKYQRASSTAIDSDSDILNLSNLDITANSDGGKDLRITGHIGLRSLEAACSSFGSKHAEHVRSPGADLPVYESRAMPGLLLIPSLLPEETQWDLTSRLLHDALADKRHKTNVGMHWELPYDHVEAGEGSPFGDDEHARRDKKLLSFFNLAPASTHLLVPRNPAEHQACTISQFLCKKLRWIDLGGQYDWTNKVYDTENAPPFPEDIAALTGSFFPNTRPDVAIVNVYSPGDTLSLHRDVSESSERGLISLSIGCDAVFVMGLKQEGSEKMKSLAVRLRSGDAIYMSGPSRYAWHGVPKIIAGTCPTGLADWPAETATYDACKRYEAWRSWMSNKRINLNIRQLEVD